MLGLRDRWALPFLVCVLLSAPGYPVGILKNDARARARAPRPLPLPSIGDPCVQPGIAGIALVVGII